MSGVFLAQRFSMVSIQAPSLNPVAGWLLSRGNYLLVPSVSNLGPSRELRQTLLRGGVMRSTKLRTRAACGKQGSIPGSSWAVYLHVCSAWSYMGILP